MSEQSKTTNPAGLPLRHEDTKGHEENFVILRVFVSSWPDDFTLRTS